MSSPLEGMKVVDLTQWVAAPHCTQLLADMGAEVLKIEDPSTGGDPSRASYEMSRAWTRPPQPGLSGLFQHFNRNKKSVAVQLKTREGQEIVHRLVEKSDVFVTNLRPRALASLAMEYDTLMKYNPRLVYASLSGYGRRGPMASSPAYAPLVLARSGFIACLGEPESLPVFPPAGLADHVAGLQLAFGIALALLNREKQGTGQKVDASLLGAAAEMSCSDIQNALLYGEARPRRSRRAPANPLYNSYLTADGKWVILTCFQTDRYWSQICKALNLESLENDPRFDSHAKRCDNSSLAVSVLDKAFSSLTLEEWSRRIAKGDLPWDVVRSFAEVNKDPQFLSNELVVDINHPVLGPTKFVGIPVEMSRTPGAIRSVAPEMGQHTEEVLTGLLGYDWDQIAQLKEKGVII